MKIGDSTTWGIVETVSPVAEGIEFVTTEGHRGYVISIERLKEMRPSLRGCSFTNNRLFEEDCSWCAVAVQWPEFFPPEALDAAKRTLHNYYPDIAAKTEGALLDVNGNRVGSFEVTL